MSSKGAFGGRCELFYGACTAKTLRKKYEDKNRRSVYCQVSDLYRKKPRYVPVPCSCLDGRKVAKLELARVLHFDVCFELVFPWKSSALPEIRFWSGHTRVDFLAMIAGKCSLSRLLFLGFGLWHNRAGGRRGWVGSSGRSGGGWFAKEAHSGRSEHSWVSHVVAKW